MLSTQGKTVVVGMSGGVDSSVSALLLKEQGFRVIGLFMKNWDEGEEEEKKGNCQWARDYRDMVGVCQKIGIPYYSVEFIDSYRKEVFNPCLEDFKKGITPNPDILCNRKIKFKYFLQHALALGGDFLATGHYCQNELIDGVPHLICGADEEKDQSYFLYGLNEKILQKVIFPIGAMKKKAVRALAKEKSLAVSDKKDSTGICFIGERDFRKFLTKFIPPHPGPLKKLDGTVVGEHMGTSFYTIGQRKGLGLGGQGQPWFVIDKDVSSNTVFVERGEHPALFKKKLVAKEIHWINRGGGPKDKNSLMAKIRYRQKEQPCSITTLEDDTLEVSFTSPQRAVTVGQSIVFYQQIKGKRVCLGGGTIVAN